MECEQEEPAVVSSRYARIFGIAEPTENVVSLVKILSVLLPTFAASFQISTTFWMIYIAESLGNGDYLAGLTLVGFLVVIHYLRSDISNSSGDGVGRLQ